MDNIPDWATHVAWLHGKKIYTDFDRMIYVEWGKVEKVDRSDLYLMRVERKL